MRKRQRKKNHTRWRNSIVARLKAIDKRNLRLLAEGKLVPVILGPAKGWMYSDPYAHELDFTFDPNLVKPDVLN